MGTTRIKWDRIHYGGDSCQFIDLYSPLGAEQSARMESTSSAGPQIYKAGDVSVLALDRSADVKRARTAVCFIHGGYWHGESDLSEMEPLVDDLVAAGIEVANVEYRMMGVGGGWPSSFFDLAASMDALYLSGISRVVLVGHSSGGQLALWLASVSENAKRSVGIYHGEGSLVVAGVVSLGGITDLISFADRGLSGGAVRIFLGGMPEEVPRRYVAVSPMELLPIGAPVLVVHSKKDSVVPIDMGRKFFQAAKSKGDLIETVEVDGEDHYDLLDPKMRSWELARHWIKSVCNKPVR